MSSLGIVVYPNPTENILIIETRLNINGATPQMIADHIKGIGIKTAREIKDLQMSLSGEKFANLEQLKQIKRVDWDSVFAADLIRV